MCDVQDMFKHAEEDTGVKVDWYKTIQPAFDEDRVIVQRDWHGKPAGFLLWQEVRDPDTGEFHWIERMLWVRPDMRGSDCSRRILARWERRTELFSDPVNLVAGGSLPIGRANL